MSKTNFKSRSLTECVWIMQACSRSTSAVAIVARWWMMRLRLKMPKARAKWLHPCLCKCRIRWKNKRTSKMFGGRQTRTSWPTMTLPMSCQTQRITNTKIQANPAAVVVILATKWMKRNANTKKSCSMPISWTNFESNPSTGGTLLVWRQSAHVSTKTYDAAVVSSSWGSLSSLTIWSLSGAKANDRGTKCPTADHTRCHGSRLALSVLYD